MVQKNEYSLVPGIALRSNKGKKELLTESYSASFYAPFAGKSALDCRPGATVRLIINVKIVVNSEAQQNKAHHFGIYYHPERAKPSDLSS